MAKGSKGKYLTGKLDPQLNIKIESTTITMDSVLANTSILHTQVANVGK